MKRLFFYIFSILPALVLISACTQEEEPQEINTSKDSVTRVANLNDDEFFSSTVERRIEIAQWFAQNYSPAEARRIHNSVLRARSLGLDEIYYLKEYASSSASANKISIEEPTKTSLRFRSDLCKRLAVDQRENLMKVTDLSSSIFDHERLEVYWPNSDSWDGVTTPVVAYAPKNLSDLRTVGFIYKNGHMNSVIVTEEYCESHPVWIITESETKYSLLPNFARGELVSPDGIFYSSNEKYMNNSELNSSINATSPSMILTLRLGTVRSEKQHDSWLAGGSEYVFSFGSLTNTDLTCEADTSRCVPLLAKTKITFTRKEIKNKTTKELNAIAVSSWPPSLRDIVMDLYEEDGGPKETKFEATLTVTWEDKKYGIDISIPLRNLDDIIAERTYARDYIISTNNRIADGHGNVTWAEDTGDGVYWTLPYNRGMVEISK